MPKREKDRASGTGRNDRDKNLALAHSRGESQTGAMTTRPPNCLKRPNNAGGAFSLALEKRSKHNYFAKAGRLIPLFYGVSSARLRQEKAGYRWLGRDNRCQHSIQLWFRWKPTEGYCVWPQLSQRLPRFWLLFKRWRFPGKGSGRTGTVIVAAENENCTTRKFVEAAVATGANVSDVGSTHQIQLAHVVEAYNQSPWTEKAISTESFAPEVVMMANPMAKKGNADKKAEATVKVGMSTREKRRNALLMTKIYKAAKWSASRPR